MKQTPESFLDTELIITKVKKNVGKEMFLGNTIGETKK